MLQQITPSISRKIVGLGLAIAERQASRLAEQAVSTGNKFLAEFVRGDVGR